MTNLSDTNLLLPHRWARTLVEDITGYYTGSVYVDKSLGREGLLGEYEDPHNGRTIAIKAHGMNGMAKKAAGVILLIRNPFDAMLSEFNRRESADHTGSADISLFNTTLWEKRITSYTSRWFTLHQKYAKELQSSQCLLVGFKQISKNTSLPAILATSIPYVTT